jgi:hypothetical protein
MNVTAMALAASSLLSSAGFGKISREEKKSRYDDYDYPFCSGEEFDRTNGDEFEMLNSSRGGRSGTEVLDYQGEKAVLKTDFGHALVNPDAVKKSGSLSPLGKRRVSGYPRRQRFL